MTAALTISNQQPTNAAYSYEALRKAGISYLEHTGSASWTDYNVHDPGITTLELLCYALTDLAYRSSNSIPDLLATPENTADNILKHFFTARHIFPNKAVTINDYRKLIVDIKGIKNCWLKKKTKQIFADLINKKLSLTQPASRRWEPVIIKGYYDVLLEFDTNITEDGKIAMRKSVQDLLMNNRNLCEDFINVEEVERQQFRLCAEIEISNTANAFDTLAKIFFNIQLHLTPLVKFYSLDEMLGQGYSTDLIFEGPLLQNGFIREEELIASNLKTEIHLSDIMHEIMNEEVVRNILDIIFNPIDQSIPLQNKWIIDVTDGRQPVIDILSSNILFYKEGNPIRPDLTEVKRRFDKLMSDHINANDAVQTTDVSFDTGVFRDVARYYSIQNHYPKNYGISPWGLPGDASNERIVQANQLKGYLYFFDQQLANYLSQLANISNLFSTQSQQHTYFTQAVRDFKDAEVVFTDPANIHGNVQAAAENAQLFSQRRNLFLDHLLARFSESFFDYAQLDPTDPAAAIVRLITSKENFLRDYPAYSTNRFNAYNYTATTNLWDTDNTSGLEKRLGRLLGFGDIRRRSLVNIYSAIRQVLNASNVPEFWFEIRDDRTGEALLIATERFASAESAEYRLEDVYAYNDIAHFSARVDDTDGKFIFELKDAANIVIAISGQRFPTLADAVKAMLELIARFSNSQAEEGMFLIEHHLLLPSHDAIASPASPFTSPLSPPGAIILDNISGFLPVCVDDNCDDCATRDPYSFRVSIVLPAYSKRFLDMDFRRYCERTIRTEMPAHIFPKICWVSNEQLREFENAYEDWLAVKSGLVQDGSNIILSRFVRILTTLKNIYPPAKLGDCSNAAERKLFLLNQNALGTIKT